VVWDMQIANDVLAREYSFFFGKEVHIHIAGLRSRTLHDVGLLVKGGS
jgi:hypothetical protein